MTPKQIESCTAKLMQVDEDAAESFRFAMIEANWHGRRAADLRISSWALYHRTLGTRPQPRAMKKRGTS